MERISSLRSTSEGVTACIEISHKPQLDRRNELMWQMMIRCMSAPHRDSVQVFQNPSCIEFTSLGVAALCLCSSIMYASNGEFSAHSIVPSRRANLKVSQYIVVRKQRLTIDLDVQMSLTSKGASRSPQSSEATAVAFKVPIRPKKRGWVEYEKQITTPLD